MCEEHADIDPLVTACGDGFAAVVEHPCEEHRNALDIRLTGLREVLDEHLRHEETVVLPLVQRVMTTRSTRRSRRRSGSRTRCATCRSSSAGRCTGCPRRPATRCSPSPVPRTGCCTRSCVAVSSGPRRAPSATATAAPGPEPGARLRTTSRAVARRSAKPAQVGRHPPPRRRAPPPASAQAVASSRSPSTARAMREVAVDRAGRRRRCRTPPSGRWQRAQVLDAAPGERLVAEERGDDGAHGGLGGEVPVVDQGPQRAAGELGAQLVLAARRARARGAAGSGRGRSASAVKNSSIPRATGSAAPGAPARRRRRARRTRSTPSRAWPCPSRIVRMASACASAASSSPASSARLSRTKCRANST